MPEENERGRVSLWPAPKMPFEAVDEAMDYLYFMQEVTNAYSTELTWALALVLGLTCLYIWRALGLQEAERLHSRMVSSRPVFSSFPSPATTTPSSVFTAAYKNRFAHKDRSRAEERERVNAIGYDILHTYNNSTPYPRHRIVSRKRNGSGLVDSSERSIPGLQSSSAWDSDLSGGGSGTFPSLISTPRCRPAGRSIVTHRTPVSSNRQENMDAKDMQTAQHHPYSYAGNHHNYYQRTQQHLNIDKIHQQIKEHQQQKPYLPTFDEVAKDEPGTLRHPVSNLPLRYRTPSPGIRKVYPVPAPRDKTPPSIKPRIESLFSELARHTSRRGDGESVKDVEGKEKDLMTAANRKDKTTGDVTVATDVSARYKNVVKSLSPIDKKLKESSRSSDQESPLGSNGHEKTPGETEKKRQGKERRQSSNERAVESSEMNSTIEQGTLPQKRTRSNKTCATVDKEIMERIRRELLMSKDDETSRYKLASTFLSEFAKSQPIRRPRHVHRESEQPPDLKHWDTPDAKRSKTKHLTKKISDTGVCKKRSKTTQKPVCKSSKQLSEEDSAIIKNKFDTTREDEPYDSAVLRAIKADEENEKAEKLAVEANDVSKAMGIVDERGESSKDTAGDIELDRNTATREAGRRLAKLRKRLEDSLEQIQKQSGLDRVLADKSRTSKMRKRREELERLTFMKEDILELETLTIRTGMNKEVTSGSISNPQPNTVSSIAEKVSTSHPVRSPVLEKEESDGGSNFPMRHNSIRITQFTGTCSCEKGTERRENNVTKIIANFSKTSSKEDTRIDRECTSARQEINTNILESSQRLLETVTADNEITTASTPDVQSHKKEKEISALSSKDSFDKSTTADENISSPRKFGKPATEGQEHEKFMTRSGKLLDEDSLEEMLEHQSKLREALKQRKKSPHVMHDPKLLIVTYSKGRTAMEKRESPNVSLPIDVKVKSPAHETDESNLSKQQSSQEKGKASTKGPETKAARLSPIVLGGTHFHNETKPDEDVMGQVLSPSSEEKLPEDGGTDNSLCVSATNFSHLRYKEPEIQQTQPSSAPLMASSPEKLWAPGFDPLLQGERENYARRRVRWRRHAERIERQRVEAEAELHKVPPPVLPKQTRLNDLVDNSAGQQNIDTAPVPSEQDNKESKFSDSQDPPEDKLVDSLHIEGLDNNTVSSDINSSEIHTNDAAIPLVSPTPVRRSNLSNAKDKNTSLAAGEMGLVKGPPENVEICEEKALSPSKAASVFDPKAQLEREKEKVEAERATRNTKEGMNPSQFKANMYLFEKAAAAEGAKPPSPECKVKASVKMFEEVSRNERT